MKNIDPKNNDLLAITAGMWRRIYDRYNARAVMQYAFASMADVYATLDESERQMVIDSMCEHFKLKPDNGNSITHENPFMVNPIKLKMAI